MCCSQDEAGNEGRNVCGQDLQLFELDIFRNSDHLLNWNKFMAISSFLTAKNREC